MALHLYDTLRRDTVPFEPRDEGKASLYLCGPTVQAGPHVGHGRGAVVFDVLRRYLIWSGYEVTLVRNVTDIDDKIIMRAQREGTTQAQIATRYAREFNQAMDALHVLPPDVEPLATGHIIEMQELIAELIEQDKAYERDGNVLFRVRKFPDYGKLSGRKIDDLVGGEDVVGSDIKDDPLDFAMWKAAKPDEPSWPSPWGEGRPGWHIECSAMASKHLGHGFDIHGGGLDLVFPHHENEITQYEAAHGEPFARHWVHNGMVRMGEEKMSKSLGNIVALQDAIDEWGPGTLRMWYLSAHHRSPLTFEDDRILDARASYTRLVTFLQTAAVALPADVEPDESAAADKVEAFRTAMDDDLNAPAAIAVLHDIASAGHEQLKAAEGGDAAAAATVAALASTLRTLADDVLGLGLQVVLERTQHLADRLAPVVADLLDQRATARGDKDFARADAIRDQLAASGVVVEDRPAGSRWYLEAFPAGSSEKP
jgi:cysteinyl-tRNA synthetase